MSRAQETLQPPPFLWIINPNTQAIKKKMTRTEKAQGQTGEG